jgi:hypothetical protein
MTDDISKLLTIKSVFKQNLITGELLGNERNTTNLKNT